MLEKVKKYVEEWHMLKKEDRVIAGISGGADSICLLFVLLELQQTIGFDVVAVHVNHGLRGEEADCDEAYVKQICREHGILCVSYFENVELIAKNRKQSTEEAGRDVRKYFFGKALQEYDGTKIALAHHKNDSAETFLMNLARGTGLKGLGGIYPVQGDIIRPLLCVERNEIEAYLDKQGIRYCVDKTNASDEYTRNRVRNHILPYLEKEVNAKTVSHIDETMAYIRQVQAFLEEQVELYLKASVEKKRNGYLVFAEKYQEIPDAIKPLLLKKLLADVAGYEKDLEASHVKGVEELFAKQVGRKVDLPYQMEGKRIYEGVLISKKELPVSEKPEGILFSPRQTVYCFGKYKITCRILEQKEIAEKSVENSGTKWFDYDIIKNGISFRTRRAGDYITIHADGRTQKLKSYFINEKIPQEERDDILLIADGSHILWIVGYRLNPAYQINKHTKHVLEIQIDEGESYGRDN
ncbi:MAG: tRNA lysidine(34) synthetase TilS [Tyzzerella sp.]|nr:tRNA lysidine(34) synthetase TilS [Tyzzerella sp.]